MLKYSVTTLVAGLLTVAVNISSAAESPFPPSSEDVLYRMHPMQERYFKEREAANANGNSTSSTSPFPPSSEDVLYRMNPVQERYFREREAANPNPTGASGSAFPTGRAQ